MIQRIKEAAELVESIRRATGKGAKTQVKKEDDKPGAAGEARGAGAGVSTPMGTGQYVTV